MSTYDDWKLATPPEYERDGAPAAGSPEEARDRLKEFYAEQTVATVKSLCCHTCGRPSRVGHAFWCKPEEDITW